MTNILRASTCEEAAVLKLSTYGDNKESQNKGLGMNTGGHLLIGRATGCHRLS